MFYKKKFRVKFSEVIQGKGKTILLKNENEGVEFGYHLKFYG